MRVSTGARAPATRRVELWWDLDPEQWWSALVGDPVSLSGGQSWRVAAADLAAPCVFSAPFEVPQVEAGDYGVMAIAIDALGSAESYAPAWVSVR